MDCRLSMPFIVISLKWATNEKEKSSFIKQGFDEFTLQAATYSSLCEV